MTVSKKKVMLLSTHDSHLPGHAWSCLQKYDKTKYEVELVSLYSMYADKTHSIISKFLLYRIINKILKIVDSAIVRRNTRYCYIKILSFPVTAKQILKKFSLGTPDIIVLHWYDGFITPKILRQLYNITSAKIVFVFTDEFSLGGGCHYPCECDGYKYKCENCPALKRFRSISQRKLRNKLNLIQSIPKVLIAPTAGILKAKSSVIFRTNTTYIKSVRGVDISYIPSQSDTRKKLNIANDEFVVMFGALNINEERKGFRYLIEALSIISSRIEKKIIALIVGDTACPIQSYSNIEYKFLGTVPFEQLCEAYVASDVYVSPSIADSGPMMLKFSIACGTPVVAFPVGYALDFIKHKETGFLVQNISGQDLAKGIMYFYENQDKRMIFANNCINLNKGVLSNGSVYNEL